MYICAQDFVILDNYHCSMDFFYESGLFVSNFYQFTYRLWSLNYFPKPGFNCGFDSSIASCKNVWRCFTKGKTWKNWGGDKNTILMSCMHVCILSLSCTSGMRKISSPSQIFQFRNIRIDREQKERGRDRWCYVRCGGSISLSISWLPLTFLQFNLWEIKSPACIEITLGQFRKTWQRSRVVYVNMCMAVLESAAGYWSGKWNLPSYCITSHWSPGNVLP